MDRRLAKVVGKEAVYGNPDNVQVGGGEAGREGRREGGREGGREGARGCVVGEGE